MPERQGSAAYAAHGMPALPLAWCGSVVHLLPHRCQIHLPSTLGLHKVLLFVRSHRGPHFAVLAPLSLSHCVCGFHLGVTLGEVPKVREAPFHHHLQMR